MLRTSGLIGIVALLISHSLCNNGGAVTEAVSPATFCDGEIFLAVLVRQIAEDRSEAIS